MRFFALAVLTASVSCVPPPAAPPAPPTTNVVVAPAGPSPIPPTAEPPRPPLDVATDAAVNDRLANDLRTIVPMRRARPPFDYALRGPAAAAPSPPPRITRVSATRNAI